MKEQQQLLIQQRKLEVVPSPSGLDDESPEFEDAMSLDPTPASNSTSHANPESSFSRGSHIGRESAQEHSTSDVGGSHSMYGMKSHDKDSDRPVRTSNRLVFNS